MLAFYSCRLDDPITLQRGAEVGGHARYGGRARGPDGQVVKVMPRT